MKKLIRQGVIPFPDMANVDCYVAEDGEAVIHEMILPMIFGASSYEPFNDKIREYESLGGVIIRGVPSDVLIDVLMDILFDKKAQGKLDAEVKDKVDFLITMFALKGFRKYGR